MIWCECWLFLKIPNKISKLSKKNCMYSPRAWRGFIVSILVVYQQCIFNYPFREKSVQFWRNFFLFLNIQCDFWHAFLGFQLGWIFSFQDWIQLVCFQDYWIVEPTSMIYRVYRKMVLQLMCLRDWEYVQKNSQSHLSKVPMQSVALFLRKAEREGSAWGGDFFDCFL